MANQVKNLEGEALSDKPVVKPIDVFKRQMEGQKSEFLKVLPSHITYEKFQRVVMTAIIMNPELLAADRQSLLVSCVKSATDGLIPDNREAALVIFNAKGRDPESGKDVWFKKVQYMPMFLGILKKVRQSEEVASIVTHVVYKRDKFEYVLGDDERIIHEPFIGSEDRGEMIAAYCIAKLKDGTIVREVMTRADIEKVRKTSKSGNDDKNGNIPKGIWKDWYEEMSRKTVFRRASKWLPQKIEIIERAFENDETMETLDLVAETAPEEIIAIEDKTAESEASTMPDLKVEIEKKKAEDAAKEKVPVETKPEAKKDDETFPGDRPSKLI